MRFSALAIGTGLLWSLLCAGCFDSGSSTVDIPTTSQPAAEAGPAYHATLVDPLYESTAGAKSVAAGDINNDGAMDFASISTDSQRVQIHLQQGLTGEFETVAIGGGAPITKPISVELADLNSDGKLDVVVLVSDTGFDNDGSRVGTIVMFFQGTNPRDATTWLQLPLPGMLPPENLQFPSGDGETDGPRAMIVGPIDGWLGPDIVVLSNGGDDLNKVYFYSNPSGAAALNMSAWTRTTIDEDIPTLAAAALGDIDGDGDLDVALNAPESVSLNLRWLENPLISSDATTLAGAPTYAADQMGSLFESTAKVKVLVTGDINGDGYLDAASISDQYQPIQVHLWNNITGVYDTVTITSGPPVTEVSDLALGDFDSDGKLDIALLVASTGLVADTDQSALVLLFQGSDPAKASDWTVVPGATGTFPINMLLNAAVTDMTIGDVDGVNGLDILVAVQGAVRLFTNPGGANARTATNWTSNVLETNVAGSAKVELADIDGDSDQDVVMTDSGGNGFNVRWLANPLVTPAGVEVSDTPTYLSDLVRPDLIDPLFESTAGAKAVAIGDINGDGEDDVASISDENQTVQVHLKNPVTGMFEPAVSIAGGGPLARMIDIEIADFNNDSAPDIVVLVNDTGFAPPAGAEYTKVGAIVLLLQGADPTNPADWTQVDFLTDPRVPVEDRGLYLPSNAVGTQDMVVGDFNDDGLPDIVVNSNEVHTVAPQTFVYYLPNPGAANVDAAVNWTRQIINSDIPDYSRLDVGDLDGDGDLDVVAAVPTSKTYNLRWLENVNHGATWNERLVGQQQGGGDVLALGDIDGDNDLDLAVSSATMNLTQWFRNPGATALGTGAVFPWEVFNIGELPDVPGKINQVQLVDLDADGHLDVFVSAYDSAGPTGTAVGFRRKADVEDTWESFQIDSSAAEYGRVAFADFDGNGRLDFLAPLNFTGLTHDRIAFYTTVTDIRWLRGVIGQQENGANYMSIGDVDLDGSPDVAVASVTNGLVQWFQNPGPLLLGQGNNQVPWKLFTIGETAEIGSPISQVVLRDLDGDNTLECFVVAGHGMGAFYQASDPVEPWYDTTIDTTDATVGRVAFTSVDGDDYTDFLVPLDRTGTVNDTVGVYTVLAQDRWRRRMIAQQPASNGILALADIDGDGNLDVASATGTLTQWFRNPGSDVLADRITQVPWDVFNIGELDASPSQIQLVDLDGNGVIHCFLAADGAGWQFTPQADVNDFWTPSAMFTTDPVADIGRPCFADFNGDGKLDFVVPLDRRELLVRDQFILLTRK